MQIGKRWTLSLLGSLLACASEAPAPTAAGADAGAVPVVMDAAVAGGLDQQFANAGFAVQPGVFEFVDMSQCCATSCAGNNPTSPYGVVKVPPMPGAESAAPFTLRSDEAVVIVAKTPPEAKYFGFTPYLMDRPDATGTRRSVFASLSETLNHRVIATASGTPFESQTVVIAAADANTVARARAALVASGLPDSAINVLTFDPVLAHFGLDAAADTFNILFRLAVVKDAEKGAQYIKSPGASVYRLTPNAPAEFMPLPSPSARTKATAPTESALQGAADRLRDAIRARYEPASTAQLAAANEGVSDPLGCIKNLTSCLGDNRDTNYPATAPRVLFRTDDDFYVVFGVNHAVTGKTSYANASVYALEKLVGILAVSSDRYAGSAEYYLPGDPEAANLYAWKFARHCDGEPFCSEVPKGACPVGIENGALGNITFRTYLEPTSNTAPTPASLVAERMFVFRKP